MFGADTMAMINAVLPFFLMGGIFYFMLWKPQKKQQQDRQNLLNSLKKGDKIITIGGIYGTPYHRNRRAVRADGNPDLPRSRNGGKMDACYLAV